MSIPFLISIHTLTLILLPFYVFRLNLYGLPSTILELLILISICSTIFIALKQKVTIKNFRTSFDYLIGLFLVSAIISLIMTPDKIGGLGIFRAYILEPMLFFYSLIFVARKYKDYTFMVYGLFGSAIVVSILGLIQRTTGLFVFAEHEQLLDRTSSFYNSANALALLIGPIIPLFIIYFLKVKALTNKLVYLTAIVFIGVVMYWTKSRGGMVASLGVIGVLIISMMIQKKNSLKKLWYFVPIAMILISGLFFYQVYKFYDPTIKTTEVRIEDDTLQIRYATWKSTVEMLTDNRVIVGTGLNGFKTTYDHYKLTAFQEDLQYPHTLVLNFWTELGLFGLLSFSAIFIYAIYLLVMMNKKNLNLLSIGLIGSFTYIYLHGLVDVPYFKNDLSIQFWTLIALVVLVKEKETTA